MRILRRAWLAQDDTKENIATNLTAAVIIGCRFFVFCHGNGRKKASNQQPNATDFLPAGAYTFTILFEEAVA